MKYTYTIHGLQCNDCVLKVKEALQRLPEIISSDVFIEKKEIIIDANQPLTVVRINQLLQTVGRYRIEEKGAEAPEKSTYTIRDFVPLIAIIAIVIGLTALKQWYYGWYPFSAMSDFMGFFFLIFGGFKVINWKGFAEAYSTYDIIAKRSMAYAYFYPLIELSLGIAYLTRWQPMATNIITFIVMTISSIGVANELRKKKTIVCACLGAVFKIPMTWVTLTEDLLMAVMAAIMLIMR